MNEYSDRKFYDENGKERSPGFIPRTLYDLACSTAVCRGCNEERPDVIAGYCEQCECLRDEEGEVNGSGI